MVKEVGPFRGNKAKISGHQRSIAVDILQLNKEPLVELIIHFHGTNLPISKHQGQRAKARTTLYRY